MLLLEDVDAAFVGRESTKEVSHRLSFSALLNSLDGIAAQEGRLLFLTTNHVDRLSQALIRPGRVDFRIKFTYATWQQMKDMFVAFFASSEGLERSDSRGYLALESDGEHVHGEHVL